jgi:site-specific DNA-methyltransferase (adenine-specific)
MNGTTRQSLARNRVIVGDAARELAKMPTASVDMALTSPPYFRLRDYHVQGQLGLEDEVDEWVMALRGVARELHRVLVPTGSFWLNVADTYSTDFRQGAGRKSLLLGPERLALGLAQDGWLLRNKIVWQKANPLPSSVRDRLTCTWEALYVFVRQPDYFFDLDTIRQPHQTKPPRIKPPHLRRRSYEAWRGPNSDDTSGLTYMKAHGRVGHPLGKNPGDVWTIASSNYRGAHHATFPVALADRAIRAGCPEARCAQCRKPWRRETLRTLTAELGEIATRGTLQPTCGCGAPSEPGLVLDPFFGAGTTGVAAEALGRDWAGIELNPAFAELAAQRIHAALPIAAAHPPPAP